jgi:porphobilinogen synthase
MSEAMRPRRLRRSPSIRSLVSETRLSVDSLVMPLFVRAGAKTRAPIAAMPGQFQWTVDLLTQECKAIFDAGIRAVLLFGVADKKDTRARGAYAADGLVQCAVSAIKAAVPELVVITDVCLCAYTPHGHCGVLKTNAPAAAVAIDEPATLDILGRVAVSHARSGADFVGPSDKMDGDVAAVRRSLDKADFTDTGILSYTVKYASAMYGPFRDAANSAPAFGDRRSYQMDPANVREALRQASIDYESGSDILLVKPALSYLDVIWRLKEAFDCPVAAFNVSGEYAMLKAAASRGWVSERAAWMEQLLCMRRAGADILITYWAKEAAKALKGRIGG